MVKGIHVLIDLPFHTDQADVYNMCTSPPGAAVQCLHEASMCVLALFEWLSGSLLELRCYRTVSDGAAPLLSVSVGC